MDVVRNILGKRKRKEIKKDIKCLNCNYIFNEIKNRKYVGDRLWSVTCPKCKESFEPY